MRWVSKKIVFRDRSFAISFERTENLNEVKNAFHENDYDLSPLIRYVKEGQIH